MYFLKMTFGAEYPFPAHRVADPGLSVVAVGLASTSKMDSHECFYRFLSHGTTRVVSR